LNNQTIVKSLLVRYRVADVHTVVASINHDKWVEILRYVRDVGNDNAQILEFDF
jgi:hypothetical protein